MKSEWKIVSLGSVLQEKGYIRGPFGSALKRGELLENGPVPVYEQQHAISEIRDFRFFIDENKYAKMKRFTVREKDIIISCSGTIGKASVIRATDPSGIISQALLILRANEKIILPEYLAIYIQSSEGYNAITSRSSGSVQVNIAKRDVIEKIPLALPSIFEQRVIAETLLCLSNKIELNNRINKNFETQAQAIFKSWFVDFDPFQDGEFVDSELGKIPKGWRVGTLGEISDIVMGQSPSGSSYNENGQGMVFYQGRAEFGDRFPKRRLFTTEPKREAQEKDILLSVRAPVGDFNIATEKCCIGRGLASITPKPSFYSYCVCLMGHLKPYFDTYNGEGTVFGSINKASLNNMKVIIPTIDVTKRFDVLICDINKIMLSYFKQNEALSVLRDTLLPKLMSGEIQIPQEV